MAKHIQMRRDTAANWEHHNPVLMQGEMGIVTDDPNLYKVGDGTTAWNSLPYRGYNGTIAQGPGESENAVMSQKATTHLVSVSQNIETGKTELLIGDTPALIVDNEPEAGSDNLVKSGGVKELANIIQSKTSDFNKLGSNTDTLSRVKVCDLPANSHIIIIVSLNSANAVSGLADTSAVLQVIAGNSLKLKVTKAELATFQPTAIEVDTEDVTTLGYEDRLTDVSEINFQVNTLINHIPDYAHKPFIEKKEFAKRGNGSTTLETTRICYVEEGKYYKIKVSGSFVPISGYSGNVLIIKSNNYTYLLKTDETIVGFDGIVVDIIAQESGYLLFQQRLESNSLTLIEVYDDIESLQEYYEHTITPFVNEKIDGVLDITDDIKNHTYNTQEFEKNGSNENLPRVELGYILKKGVTYKLGIELNNAEADAYASADTVAVFQMPFANYVIRKNELQSTYKAVIDYTPTEDKLLYYQDRLTSTSEILINVFVDTNIYNHIDKIMDGQFSYDINGDGEVSLSINRLLNLKSGNTYNVKISGSNLKAISGVSGVAIQIVYNSNVIWSIQTADVEQFSEDEITIYATTDSILLVQDRLTYDSVYKVTINYSVGSITEFVDEKISKALTPEEQKDIDYWGVIKRLTPWADKPLPYQAWPLGSFYDKNDKTFNIISNFVPSHTITTASVLTITKINLQGEIIGTYTIAESDSTRVYCIGGICCTNGDYICIVRDGIYRSHDNGETWTLEPLVIDNVTISSSAMQIGTMYMTSTNRILCFVYQYGASPDYQSLIIYSDDNGETWSTVSLPNSRSTYMEAQFVEIDGTIYSIIRNLWSPDFCSLISSDDDGLTWSNPIDLLNLDTDNGISMLYSKPYNTVELTFIDRTNIDGHFYMRRKMLSLQDFISGNIDTGIEIAQMDATSYTDCGYQRTLIGDKNIVLLVYYDYDKYDNGCCINYAMSKRDL